MSEENVEVVRKLIEAWNAGDMDAFRDLYDPRIIMRPPERWPEPGPFVGREAVMREWHQTRETWRDLAAMTHWFAPEVEWEPGGPAAVERALYRGRDEVSSGFASTWETWEVFQVEESEVRDLGDSVVWLGSAHMRGGDANHLEFDQPFAIDFLLRGGKVARFRGFLSWQEALEAAGIEE